MISNLNTCLLALAFLLPLFTAGQKFEKEYRIEPEEVPENALQFIHSPDRDLSEKWYYEESQGGSSVEAKFKHQNKWHSVEFDTLGNLQDIEVEADFSELPVTVKSAVQNSLRTNYSKYNIRKTQIQYSGNIVSFSDYMKRTKSEQYDIRYEMVVKAKKNGKWNLYEISFNHCGELEKTEQIILRNTDNLEF